MTTETDLMGADVSAVSAYESWVVGAWAASACVKSESSDEPVCIVSTDDTGEEHAPLMSLMSAGVPWVWRPLELGSDELLR